MVGAVLIWSGVSSTSIAAGSVAASCTTPSANCPTSSITFNETTTGPGTQPSQWTVTVTSSCAATMRTVHVPNNGSVTVSGLFVYTDTSHSTACSYRFKETAAARFTKTFDPASPVTLAGGSFGVTVAITNLSSGSSSSGGTPTTTAPTTTTPATPSTTPPSSGALGSSTARTFTTPASFGALPTVIARTGPATHVGTSVLTGGLLCLLGGAVLFLARRPRTRQH